MLLLLANFISQVLWNFAMLGHSHVDSADGRGALGLVGRPGHLRTGNGSQLVLFLLVLEHQQPFVEGDEKIAMSAVQKHSLRVGNRHLAAGGALLVNVAVHELLPHVDVDRAVLLEYLPVELLLRGTCVV